MVGLVLLRVRSHGSGFLLGCSELARSVWGSFLQHVLCSKGVRTGGPFVGGGEWGRAHDVEGARDGGEPPRQEGTARKVHNPRVRTHPCKREPRVCVFVIAVRGRSFFSFFDLLAGNFCSLRNLDIKSAGLAFLMFFQDSHFSQAVKKWSF